MASSVLTPEVLISAGIVVGASALLYLRDKCRSQSVKFPRARKVTMKSKVLPGSKVEGATPIYTSPFPLEKDEEVKTLHDNFLHGWKRNPNAPCLGTRPIASDGSAGPYAWQTYNEVKEACDAFGSGMTNMGLTPPSADPHAEGKRFLGFYTKNCAEWIIASQACNKFGVVVVPLYDTLGASAVQYVVNQTQLTTVLVSSTAELDTVNAVAKNCPCLTTAVLLNAKSAPSRDTIKVVTFNDVVANGKESPVDPPTVSEDDIATFCYTSGTTGDPKGAMLTHKNILCCMFSAMSVGLKTYPTDVHISYLPLAHMFERIVDEALFYGGASIGFYQGNTLKLLQDIAALRPTIFPSVPRLFNKIYDKVMAGAMAGGLKTKLFKAALNAKIAGLRKGYLEHPVWDKLVMKKIGARVGLGRCRLMITGSAPIAPHVMDFLRVAFVCPVQEGYGQTESGAAATLTLADDYSVGHVGAPIPCNEVRLVDVAEMGYLSTDTEHNGVPCKGRGEICFRGDNIFVGYYKNPAKTAEAIDDEGWLHSGDIGIWTERGELRIVDRKKNIFKLSQGEYVAAEKIENIHCGSSKFVAQNFVHGDSLHNYLVAVVVPDVDILMPWAKEAGIEGDFAAVCANPKVNKMILEDMRRVCTEAELKGFEKVRAIHLESELWTAENGVLTPTFKLKRLVARKKYKADIDRMYANDAIGGRSGLAQG